LRACLARVRPDVVVPGDDGVVAQLHALHESDPSLRPLIEASLGAPSGYHVVASRHRLLHTARELGIATPETRVIRRVGDLSAWHMDHPSGVLKSDGECGGNGVRICHSLRDSLAAWRELTAPR